MSTVAEQLLKAKTMEPEAPAKPKEKAGEIEVCLRELMNLVEYATKLSDELTVLLEPILRDDEPEEEAAQKTVEELPGRSPLSRELNFISSKLKKVITTLSRTASRIEL